MEGAVFGREELVLEVLCLLVVDEEILLFGLGRKVGAGSIGFVVFREGLCAAGNIFEGAIASNLDKTVTFSKDAVTIVICISLPKGVVATASSVRKVNTAVTNSEAIDDINVIGF